MRSTVRARRNAVSAVVSGALVTALVVPGASARAADDHPAVPPDRSVTSTDRGDGTYGVPLLNADVPDISVARVPAAENDEGRDVYYMMSTTMHLSPGAPVMKSYDLVNWEIVNYVYDRLSIGDASSLRNGQNSYGEGQWASSLRYRDGRFYVVFNTNNVGGAYLYSTDDIENGSWDRVDLGRGLHDASLFFDEQDGGTPYIFYGSGTISAVRLDDDLTRVVEDFPDVFSADDYAGEPFIGGLFEGAQVHYIDGEYYIAIITWPPGQNRQEVLFRSPHLLGRHDTEDGSNPYVARSALNSDGFAQGGLVEVPDGAGGYEWWGMFFRDTYPLGRIPALIPATWEDGWPTFGDDGVVRVGDTFDKPIQLSAAEERRERLKSIVASDDFANDAPHKPFRDAVWELPPRPDVDESLVGVELLENGGFESGELAPWQEQYTADLTVVSDDPASGSASLRVENRVNNGSGPGQVLDGKIQNGVTYTGSMRVRYTEGPATMRFILGASYGQGIKVVASAVATKGEWTTVTGSFPVGADVDVSRFTLVVETPWGPNQTPADQVDYEVDDVSLVGQPDAREYPDADELAYNGSDLDLAWQWNHNPDNRFWSLTEREGWLRLTNGHVVTGDAEYSKAPGRDLTYLEEARNTLSQRTFGPRASAETRLDVSRMADGDVAGLAVYGRSFAYAGVKQVDGARTLGLVTRLQPFSDSIDPAAVEAFVPGSTIALGPDTDVRLKADADFESSPGQLWVQYSYSLDGTTWTALGEPQGPLVMDWSLSHFMGYRFGLFNYATEQTGGTVDVDYYYLSDTLDADGGADRGPLDAAIAEAEALDETRYTADSWADVEDALAWARATTSPTTQNQVDAPAHALTSAVASLVEDEEAGVQFSAEAHVRSLAGKAYLTVRVRNDDDVPVDVVINTPYGSRTFPDVLPGKNAYQAFATRESATPSGEAEVTVTRTTDGQQSTRSVPYDVAGS